MQQFATPVHMLGHGDRLMKWRCAVIAIALFSQGGAGAQQEPSALVELATAEQGTLNPSVGAYGTVAADPAYITTIALRSDGIITAVSVRVGQVVDARQAVVTVETAPNALASYQQAESAVTLAQQDLAHTQQLFNEHLATNTQLAAAQKTLADAEAQLKAQTETGAQRPTQTLNAPAAGIVIAVNATPGDRMAANSVIASIVPRDRLILNLGLEPEDALQVPVGADVSLQSPQAARLSFKGKIQSVDALMEPKSRLVNAVATVPQDIAGNLILGVVLEGVIQLPAKSGIVVPHAALMTGQNGAFVFVVVNGIAQRRDVEVAMQTDQQALISSGIMAGEAVVVGGNVELTDGMRVRTS
jgi:membrane fusion protein, multidrug efflux system